MKKLSLFSILLLLFVCPSGVFGEDATSHEEDVRRTTAVALNYCRAALHRIRRHPDKAVLLEEQQRILNNIDLNKIEDPEVIALYKSILDEISTVEISDRERVVIDEQFRRNSHRQLGTSFFVVGAQVATGQLGSAIQSGANSWWDYRNQEVRRDSDQWKVERNEMTSLMSRSGTFLDSFWRLSQKNNIPDRWLIRDDDLDQLGRVLAEQDPSQRLRMLTRMERFMECYPPYWYYVGRTQQQLGMTEEALGTYQRLTAIGRGHFRQDDMLAASMANMALLLEMNGDPSAPDVAFQVPDFSIRSWESNLISAWVLGRHQRFSDAEELILCNLDEDQETGQSRVALVSLYYHSEDKVKLAALLDDPQILSEVPIPGLLLSTRLLEGKVPARAQQFLVSSLNVMARTNGRRDSVSLMASAAWKLQDAQPKIRTSRQEFHQVGYRPLPRGIAAEFASEAAGDEESSTDVDRIQLILNYPETPPIHVWLSANRIHESSNRSSGGPGAFLSGQGNGRLALFPTRDVQYQIREIEMDGIRLSLGEPALEQDRKPESRREVSIDEDPVYRF
ncbi:MAG: hypothetical protein KDA81_05325 [Planctomycetaceae bacterium]|nr:hypothetical protein [Planctomycetaceae bacterium]